MYPLVLLVALSVLLSPSHAQAVEALSTDELVSHCEIFEDEPDSKDGIFCARYIQGFIDGAVATDERVTYNVAAELDRDRLRPTRAGRAHRLERQALGDPRDFDGLQATHQLCCPLRILLGPRGMLESHL